MRLNQSTNGQKYSVSFIRRIKSGELKKDCQTNHNRNFTGAPEELAREQFNSYIGSAGCFIRNMRKKEGGNVYYGQ
ncbi:MAG: hypothetical protein RR446_03595 [Lachnospiraceae bacterium]